MNIFSLITGPLAVPLPAIRARKLTIRFFSTAAESCNHSIGLAIGKVTLEKNILRAIVKIEARHVHAPVGRLSAHCVSSNCFDAISHGF